MSKDSAPWFIEHEVSELCVVGNEPRLFPKSIARGGSDPADDNVSNLAFRVAGHNVDDPTRPHLLNLSRDGGSVSEPKSSIGPSFDRNISIPTLAATWLRAERIFELT